MAAKVKLKKKKTYTRGFSDMLFLTTSRYEGFIKIVVFYLEYVPSSFVRIIYYDKNGG